MIWIEAKLPFPALGFAINSYTTLYQNENQINFQDTREYWEDIDFSTFWPLKWLVETGNQSARPSFFFAAFNFNKAIFYTKASHVTWGDRDPIGNYIRLSFTAMYYQLDVCLLLCFIDRVLRLRRNTHWQSFVSLGSLFSSGILGKGVEFVAPLQEDCRTIASGLFYRS